MTSPSRRRFLRGGLSAAAGLSGLALAARIGAVNTVVSEDGMLVGYNTDAPGFLEPLRPLLDRQHLFRMARVLGTGGAARAIIAVGAGVAIARRKSSGARDLAAGGYGSGNPCGGREQAPGLRHSRFRGRMTARRCAAVGSLGRSPWLRARW